MTDPLRRIEVRLRSRVEPFKGAGDWIEVNWRHALAPTRCAIVICDMWDKHWCDGATRRVDAMVPQMNRTLTAARALGMHIVHAPSDTMRFYADSPQRRRMQALPKVEPPASLPLSDPPLPIDDSDGGCDTGQTSYKAWSRQHPGLAIADGDGVSDDGREVYNLIRQHDVEHLIIMGVHTNMCILGRSFAIRQMTRWGVRCLLVRDLTDAMYNPTMSPYVSHAEGTALVIEHIERHWCPTILSDELIAAAAPAV